MWYETQHQSKCLNYPETIMAEKLRLKAIALLLALSVVSFAYSQDARDILDKTGVQGGLVVHLGCGDGRLTAALRASNSYLVHGLDPSEGNVAKGRGFAKSKGLYGRVTIDILESNVLPYSDNLVNLLVSEDLGGVSMDEVLRVLVPKGVAYIRADGKWTKTIKPRGDNIDQWTHYLHDSTNNAVAQDTVVGPPKHLQWKAGPRWGRNHEYMGSIRGMVATEERVFYLLDAGLTGTTDKLPQRWNLVARDAFNGILLWRQRLNWESVRGGTWSGMSLPRLLVAIGEKVFVAKEKDRALVCLDAATGKVIKQYDGIIGVHEVLYSAGKLILHVKGKDKPDRSITVPGHIVAVDAESGKELWRKTEKNLLELSLAATDKRVCYRTSKEIVMVELHTGEETWRKPNEIKTAGRSGGTLVFRGQSVFLSAEGHFRVFSAKDGALLWEEQEGPGGTNDIFLTGNLIWHGRRNRGQDPATGKVVRELWTRGVQSPGHHFRCYRSKATVNWLLSQKRGVEFVDISGEGKHSRHDWVRAMCRVGFMPCNGILYSTPHPCFCYPGVKINGFNALRNQVQFPTSDSDVRLVRGPAFGKIDAPAQGSVSKDWPTYRHDAKRSGSIKLEVSTDLKETWRQEIKGDLTPPVYADGKVFICNKDDNTVYCLHGNTGRTIWEYTAGGKVNLPPTIHKGAALFGSADGWVYCVHATDGALAWKFRPAPDNRRIIAYDRLESPWPVHGSILVQNDTAYFAAGRSTFLDGGIYLYGLNPATGEKRYETRLDGPHPDWKTERGKPFDMPGALSDILVSDGKNLYMMQKMFDEKLTPLEAPYITEFGDRKMGRHLIATAGFLDDTNFNRIYWMYCERWPGFYFATQAPKAGQLLVFDDKQTYAVKFFTRHHVNSPVLTPADKGYLLFADDNDNEPGLVGEGTFKSIKWLPFKMRGASEKYSRDHDAVAANKDKSTGYTRSKPPAWMTFVKIRVRAMVLADQTLFIAGVPDEVPADDPYAAMEGKLGSIVRAVSAKDGKTIAEIKLESQPVFDGMIAAAGRLFLCTEDGKLLCFGTPE